MKKTKLIACGLALLLSAIGLWGQGGTTYFKEFPGQAAYLDNGIHLTTNGKALTTGSFANTQGLPLTKIDIASGVVDTAVSLRYDQFTSSFFSGRFFQGQNGETYLLTLSSENNNVFNSSTNLCKLNSDLDVEWTKSWGASISPQFPNDTLPTFQVSDAGPLGNSKFLLAGYEYLMTTDLTGSADAYLKIVTSDTSQKLQVFNVVNAQNGDLFLTGTLTEGQTRRSWLVKMDTSLNQTWGWMTPPFAAGLGVPDLKQNDVGEIFWVASYLSGITNVLGLHKFSQTGVPANTVWIEPNIQLGIEIHNGGPVINQYGHFWFFDSNLSPLALRHIVPPNWEPFYQRNSFAVLTDGGILTTGNYPGTNTGPYPYNGPHYAIRTDSNFQITNSCLVQEFPFSTLSTSYAGLDPLTVSIVPSDTFIETGDSIFSLPVASPTQEVNMTLSIQSYTPPTGGQCNGTASAVLSNVNFSFSSALTWSSGEIGSMASSLCPGQVIAIYGDTNDCIITDTIGVATSLIAAQHQPFTVEVYPNPASDYLQVQAAGHLPNARLQVTDVTGKAVLRLPAFTLAEGQSQRIDLTGLAPGAYFIEVHTAQHRWAKAFTKN